MEIRYAINPETGLPHILDHDVAPEEVEDVLAESPEDRRNRNDTRVAVGRTSEGRLLRVVYARRRVRNAPDGILVITAYELRGNDVVAFRRRMRRRNR